MRIGDVVAYTHGAAADVPVATGRQALAGPEVIISADLGTGDAHATAWGCDLTEGYVRINAEYTT